MSFSREPALWIALATAVIELLVVFGLDLPDGGQAAIVAVLTALAGVAIRSQVTPASSKSYQREVG